MAPGAIRKVIGAVKDKTSIGLAKVAGNIAPDLEVLIVKATSHDNEPADEKYIREILNSITYSRGYVIAAVRAISKRLSKTRDCLVALKAFMLIHSLLSDGGPVLGREIVCAFRDEHVKISDLWDEAHSNSSEHSNFVTSYASYLDQMLVFLALERELNGSVFEDKKYDDIKGEYMRDSHYRDLTDSTGQRDRNNFKPVREMKPEMIVKRLNQLLELLACFLCIPREATMNSGVMFVAQCAILKESFRLYNDLCEMLGVLFDKFSAMEYADCVKAFDAYVTAAERTDVLAHFYNWCKNNGIARSSELPEVQKISDELIGTLKEVLKEKSNKPQGPEKIREESFSLVKEEEAPQINESKVLPAPPVGPQPPKAPTQQVTEDLVNWKDDGVSVDEQGNKLALAFFAGLQSGSWETFPTDEEPNVTSPWHTPAAESGNADWELMLVESASNLSNQKANLAGGFDQLLLNGMYDQGAVNQHVNTSQLSGWGASSVALPRTGKNTPKMLALPAPDGTLQPVGQQDPFAASLSIPPPSYVQIADIERKQQLLSQEQQFWQQYVSSGMQGQMAFAKVGRAGGYNGNVMQPVMPYGMAQVTGMGQLGGYYYAPY